MRGFVIFTMVVYGILIVGTAGYIYVSNRYLRPMLLKPPPRAAPVPAEAREFPDDRRA